MKKKISYWNKDIAWYKNFHIRPVTINGYVFFILVLYLALGYYLDIQQYQELAEDPCSFCDISAVCAINYGGEEWKREDITNEYTLNYSVKQSIKTEST